MMYVVVPQAVSPLGYYDDVRSNVTMMYALVSHDPVSPRVL